MTSTTWEKTSAAVPRKQSERWKFLLGGLLLLGAVGYLVISSTLSGAQYFMTLDELVNDAALVGKTVRISGAVIGETIVYDDRNLVLDFTVAHVENDYSDLALALHQAVLDTSRTRLSVHIENEVKPDLLQNEAQAILSGYLGEDGVFYANELLLKCPSRYGEDLPEQVKDVNTYAG
ncbi:MAG: hypothetical protein OHK0046_33960 [Anaerolineae bacterium]